ncbi:MAG: hypothetical protein QY323_02565 [Patescibacteria group bacterium]|nr:MAG: hypothetical protein QY323_02565 [Patescibacteria group bacterium]
MSNAVPQLLFVRRVLRLAWFVLGALLLGWIIWRNVPPSGVVRATARTAEPNGFIEGFTPLDRARPVQERGAWYSDVVNEPVYFHVAAPRLYDRVRVRLRYKLDGQPYVGLGARTDLATWSFDVKPIDVPMLDEAGWTARQDGELRVYERKATSRPAAEVLETGSRVAVLGLDPVRWSLKLPPLSNEKAIDVSLEEKGSRTIYTYVQGGAFEMSLGLRGAGASEARVALVRDGKTLLTRTHRGDGAVALSLSGAEPGLYRVDLAASDDVTLVGMTSRQSRVVLLDTAGEHLHAPKGAVRFDPEFPVVTWETNLAKAPYDAIVARYRPPELDADGWRVAEASFDLSSVAASQGRLQMILSLPAIKSVGGSMRVDRVDVEYVRPPIEPKRWLDLLKLEL